MNGVADLVSDPVTDVVTDPHHAGWRAQLIVDHDADQPWGDAQAPALLVDRHGKARLAAEVFQPARGDRIEFAYEHFADLDLFGRYLGIHHGTTALVAVAGPDCTVLIFDTAAFRAHAGIAGACDLTGEQTEWRAWLDGDVYGVIVEHRIPARSCVACGHREPERWREVDACWGFYGGEHAATRALDLLRDAAAAPAAREAGAP